MRSESTSAFGQPRLTKPMRGDLAATAHFTGTSRSGTSRYHPAVKFTKMHGLGNDFIVFDAPAAGAPSTDAFRRLADRFTGIGFDQALMLEPPRRPGTAVYYRIFNADGREVEQCGNGARCIARLLHERRAGQGGELVLDSPGGLVQTRLQDGQVSVTMGVPSFDPAALPFEAS